MQITRSSIDTAKGPETWFTGDVYIDPVAAAAAPARVQANLVHFTPGARPAWHTHPLGQPDEDHWHGAPPNRFMAHLALNEVDDDHVAAHWGDKVTDDEYAAASEG